MSVRLPGFIQQRMRRRPQVYLRPTVEGGWWLGTLCLLMLMGWGYTNNICLALGMLLMAVTVVLLMEAHFNLDGLRLHGLTVEDQFQGRPAPWRLFWSNKRVRARHKVSVCWDGPGPCAQFSTDAQESGEAQGSWSFQRRGVWRQTHVVLRSRYPLGLFEAWSYHRVEVEVWVYPPLLVGPVTSGSSMESEGSSKAVESLHGDEPGDFRRYHAGDAPSRVAWKALARGLPAHSKTFLEERTERIHYVWPWGQGDEEARGRLAHKIETHHRAQEGWSVNIRGVNYRAQGQQERQRALRALSEAP